jgi:hypothetical protein
MRKRATFFILSLIFIFFTLILCGSQREAVCGDDYRTLLTRVKDFDRSVDFKALRLSYTKTEDYNPYRSDDSSRNAMLMALKEKEYKKVIEHAQAILQKNYVDIDAHFVSTIAYRELGDQKKQEFHDFVARGLIDSIMDSGDGQSPETAFQVIDTKEEYVILAVLGLAAKKQKLLHIGGHAYDQFEVADRKTGQTGELYFNVDIPFGWLSGQFKK